MHSSLSTFNVNKNADANTNPTPVRLPRSDYRLKLKHGVNLLDRAGKMTNLVRNHGTARGREIIKNPYPLQYRFQYRFLIDFGSIWGGPWTPKSFKTM